jgi:hypothetical protein
MGFYFGTQRRNFLNQMTKESVPEQFVLSHVSYQAIFTCSTTVVAFMTDQEERRRS